ncbi:ribosome maturation factor RimP [Cytophagaceae bacterium ABcell3]|nr:ribosome maturation factor RimP [Cytophagaceae bacterium ABcell3]
MELKEQITEITNKYITDPSFFLVDVIISGNSGMTKIKVILDGDKGVSIDDCASISRKVASEIEENKLIENAHVLEVTSPGLDQPITMLRQYKKNIGRKVEVTVQENKVFKGELKEVYDDKIIINAESGKGKKTTYALTELPMKDIIKTNILVSFS